MMSIPKRTSPAASPHRARGTYRIPAKEKQKEKQKEKEKEKEKAAFP